MTDLLDRVRAEIRERLDASRDAVREYHRLQAALEALDAPSADGSRRVESHARSGRSRQRRRPAGGKRKRAPRGANREAVLRVVNERPGITPAELASAAGVEKRTLYTLLSTLTKQGALERQELPAGQTGCRLPREDAGAAASSGALEGASPPPAAEAKPA